MFQINRIRFVDKGDTQKINTKFDFPLEMNINQFLHQDLLNREGVSDGSISQINQSLIRVENDLQSFNESSTNSSSILSKICQHKRNQLEISQLSRLEIL